MGVVWTERGRGALQDFEGLPLGVRLQTLPWTVAAYLGKTVLPFDLCAYYPRPLLDGWSVGLATLLLVGLVVLVVAGRRRLPHLAHGVAWFLLALTPVSGVLHAVGIFMADRYVLVPHLGLVTGVVLELAGRAPFTRPRVAALVAGAVAAVFALVSALQVTTWKDSETLFRATLKVAPDNPFIQTSLGLLLLKEGRAAEALAPLATAAPRYAYGQAIQGLALWETGQAPAALRALGEALARAPGDDTVRALYSQTLVKAALRELSARRLEQARTLARLATEVDARNDGARRLLTDLARPDAGPPRP